MPKQPVNHEKRRREHAAQVVAQHRCRRFKFSEPGQLAGQLLIQIAWYLSVGHGAAGYLKVTPKAPIKVNLQRIGRLPQAKLHSRVEA